MIWFPWTMTTRVALSEVDESDVASLTAFLRVVDLTLSGLGRSAEERADAAQGGAQAPPRDGAVQAHVERSGQVGVGSPTGAQ